MPVRAAMALSKPMRNTATGLPCPSTTALVASVVETETSPMAEDLAPEGKVLHHGCERLFHPDGKIALRRQRLCPAKNLLRVMRNDDGIRIGAARINADKKALRWGHFWLSGFSWPMLLLKATGMSTARRWSRAGMVYPVLGRFMLCRISSMEPSIAAFSASSLTTWILAAINVPANSGLLTEPRIFTSLIVSASVSFNWACDCCKLGKGRSAALRLICQAGAFSLALHGSNLVDETR